MHTRYIITGIKKDGVRHMALNNNSNNTHLKKEDAEKQLSDIIAANHPTDIANTLGTKLRIDEVQCYQNGDSAKTVFSK